MATFTPQKTPIIPVATRLKWVLKLEDPLKPIKNEDELQEIIIEHLRYFINNPKVIKSACKISEKIN
ncbi:MAG: hypothetical protein K8T10_21060 [Candidatus Eremiobacteraeota bacterium]|nr:hypothetical protein [Candidatus Eremiobacteraeota bacterium]